MKTKLTTMEVFRLVSSGKITPEEGADLLYEPTALREALTDALIWELFFLVQCCSLIELGERVWGWFGVVMVSMAIVDTFRKIRKTRKVL